MPYSCKHLKGGKICGKPATYGVVPGERRYCKECKENHYPLARTTDTIACAANTPTFVCWTTPSFINKRTGIRYCKAHYEYEEDDGFIEKKTGRKCIYCGKVALFGIIKGSSNTLYCNDCRKKHHPDAFNVRDCCIYGDCRLTALYNEKGKTKGLYCKSHSKGDMIDVNAARCDWPGCGTIASYGQEGKRHNRCSTHAEKEAGMVRRGSCLVEGCHGTAAYTNIENSKDPLFCYKHSDLSMKRTTAYCIVDGCLGIAKVGKKSRQYCDDHFDPDTMRRNPDRKKCIHEGCETTPSLGPLFSKKIHCSAHKLNNDFRFNNPKCEFEGCENQPWFTDKGNYPIRCEDHQLPNDKNVVSKKCSSCSLDFYLLEGVETCDVCLEGRRAVKIKENELHDFLIFNKFEIKSYNKPIPEGCSDYRPDFLMTYGVFNIIVECDEFQHKRYNDLCEINRMKDTFGALKEDRYLIFVRYNPDAYIDSNGIKGKDRKQTRLKTLKRFLEYLIWREKEEDYPKSKLTVYYLYYDGFDKMNVKGHSLNPYKV